MTDLIAAWASGELRRTGEAKVNDAVISALWETAAAEGVDPYECIPMIVQTFYGLLDIDQGHDAIMARLLGGLTPTQEVTDGR